MGAQGDMNVLMLVLLIVAMALAIPLVGIIAWATVASAKARHGGGKMNGDEARLVQDLNRGFADLEKRIEALETLLLDGTERDREGREEA